MTDYPHLTVTIRYQYEGDDEQVLHLTAEEFFDPIEDDDDEPLEVDSVPRFLESKHYLPESDKRLCYVEDDIVDSEKQKRQVTRTLTWGPHYLSVLRKIERGEEVERMITVQLWESSPHTFQTLRVIMAGDNVEVNQHDRICDPPEGATTIEDIVRGRGTLSTDAEYG